MSSLMVCIECSHGLDSLSGWMSLNCTLLWLFCTSWSLVEVDRLSALVDRMGDLLIMLTVYMDSSANLTVL